MVKKVFYISITFCLFFLTGTIFTKSLALEPGNAVFEVWAEIDGRATNQTALSGVTISAFTPLGKDVLNKEQNYNGRGAAPAMYFVTGERNNGSIRAHMGENGGGVQCGSLSSYDLRDFWGGMWIYGPTFRAMPFGGDPEQDGVCNPTTNPRWSINGVPLTANGYLGSLQCLTAVYNQFGVNITLSEDGTREEYRFVPFFPQGWSDSHNNLALPFDPSDPKGGGYFTIQPISVTQEQGDTVFRRDAISITMQTDTNRFPASPQTVYLGRDAHPLGDTNSESGYLRGTGNTAVVRLRWIWTAQYDPPPEVQCGEACGEANNGAICPTGNICQEGVCVIDTCATNPQFCNADLCSINEPICGETCDLTGEINTCSTGNTCVEVDGEARCVLNACTENPEQCSDDLCSETNITELLNCGEICESESDCREIVGEPGFNELTCADHNNDGVSRCVILQCTDNTPPEDGGYICDDLGCEALTPTTIASPTPTVTTTIVTSAIPTTTFTPTSTVVPTTIPETALISDEVDSVILGILLVMVALLIIRFDLVNRSFKFFLTQKDLLAEDIVKSRMN